MPMFSRNNTNEYGPLPPGAPGVTFFWNPACQGGRSNPCRRTSHSIRSFSRPHSSIISCIRPWKVVCDDACCCVYSCMYVIYYTHMDTPQENDPEVRQGRAYRPASEVPILSLPRWEPRGKKCAPPLPHVSLLLQIVSAERM